MALIGNSNSVNVEVLVDGKPYTSFIYLNLDQYVSTHHTFEVAVDYRNQKDSVWTVTVDDIFRETLNKPISIRMTHVQSGDVNEFEGVVTDIEVVGIDGDKGAVILRGGSPTVLLDRDPAMTAFTDQTLRNIVADTIEKTAVKVELDNKPELEAIIPYVSRYRETSYGFLNRILSLYGEWFYYDGKKLIVGNPKNEEEVKLTFDVELREVRTMAGLRNLNTQYYDYIAQENSYLEEASGTINNANLPMKGAKQIADELYPTPTKMPVGRSVLGEDDMSKIVRVNHNREYTKTSIFTASAKTCGVRIGEVATIHLPDSLEDVTFKDLGSFRVLEVHHRVIQNGAYECIFRGITAATETLPNDHIALPQAFQEVATVVDNADPENQGRVKVRFMWQAEDEATNWVRVQTPDAGMSDVVAANRGFVFIPEIDDQVMIGFEMGDPSRPYVMGSLFHRDNASGATEKNTVKSITTRSGSVLRFTDSEDDKSFKIELQHSETDGIALTIIDGEGTMTIQTSKNIYIKSPELIQFESKQIIMLAEDVIQAKAENKIEMIAESVMHLESSDKMELMAVSIAEEAESELTMKGADVVMKADSSAAIDGGSKLDIKAGQIKMN